MVASDTRSGRARTNAASLCRSSPRPATRRQGATPWSRASARSDSGCAASCSWRSASWPSFASRRCSCHTPRPPAKAHGASSSRELNWNEPGSVLLGGGAVRANTTRHSNTPRTSTPGRPPRWSSPAQARRRAGPGNALGGASVPHGDANCLQFRANRAHPVSHTTSCTCVSRMSPTNAVCAAPRWTEWHTARPSRTNGRLRLRCSRREGSRRAGSPGPLRGAGERGGSPQRADAGLLQGDPGHAGGHQGDHLRRRRVRPGRGGGAPAGGRGGGEPGTGSRARLGLV